jgi:hypothetical protein
MWCKGGHISSEIMINSFILNVVLISFVICCYVQDAKELLNNFLEQIRAGKSSGEINEAADQGMKTRIMDPYL